MDHSTPQPETRAVDLLRRKFKDGTPKDIWIDWKWIWTFSKNRKGSILLYTLFGLLSSGLGLLSGLVSKYLINSIEARDLPLLLRLIVLLILSAVLGVVFRSLTSRFSAKLSVSMHNDVLSSVFRSLLRSDWLSVTRYPTGDLLNRFSGDVATVANNAVSWLPTVIIQLFTVVVTLIIILFFDPWMALICLASTPVLILCSHSLIRKQRAHNRKMRQVTSGMAAFESEAFRNTDTIKSFGVEDTIQDHMDTWQDDYRSATLDYNKFSIRTNALLTVLGTVVQYIAMGYCLWQLWQDKIDWGTLVLFLQLRSYLQSAFSSLVSQIPTALSASVAAERVRELTELPKESPATDPLPGKHCRIRLQNVRAAYDDQRQVLSSVALEAAPGEIVALVGPSGEGKTTILRLLLGLVRPQEGTMTIEDETGTCRDLDSTTRRCFTYVPQGNTLLAGTVADNLRLVREDVSEEEMIAALQDACAWEFVQELPQGLHSPIGEGGKGLSEGQAQRIAIARALLRKAPAMLLDEVTSALDQETEKQVLQNLMRRGVTCIVTTHRPSVLNHCARAYRVHDGQVELLSPEKIHKMIDDHP